jgi:transcriptional regulator with XRE-family HTH domain
MAQPPEQYPAKETLGSRIKAARKQVNLSQKDFAELLGVGQSAVAQWETNRVTPLHHNLTEIAKILGVSLSSLFHASNEEGAPRFIEAVEVTWQEATAWETLQITSDSASRTSWTSPIPCRNEVFVVRHITHAVWPSIPQNSLLFVDPVKPMKEGAIVLIQPQGVTEAVVRRVIVEGGERFFESLNPSWPQPILGNEKVHQYIGTVIASVQVW